MADPLDALRTPDAPVAPDPQFASRLRARIERALALPKGVTVSTTTLDQPAATSAAAGSGALTPYLAVADARAAIDWYVDVLGARQVGEPIVMPDDKIGHAELELAGARIFLSDEHPEYGVAAPLPGRGAGVSLDLEVPDADAAVARAAAANATVEREPSDNPYGRIGVIRDPFGHRWMLNAPTATPSETARDGDVGFFSLCVDDVDAAAAFYATVLGWSYAEDSGPRRTLVGMPFVHRINALADLRGHIWDPGHPTMYCSRGVADVDAAVERVRAAGGRSTDPEETPHGRHADCVDDQGMPFSLHEYGSESARPAMNGARPGDVAYLTMHMRSGAQARDFYGAVFGWTFTPGRVADGWEPHDPAPMHGMHGGSDDLAQEPMYRVDDIAAAVERVRAAGGTSTEPERQPYGVSAHCADDQGMPFYLGEL